MNLHDTLFDKFGYTNFRKGQEEIITDVLNGKDVVAMLPTGGGKSLCYLLPGYVQKGTVIIVSPLLSLMEDQIQQLRLIGEKRAIAINSFLNFEERQYAIRNLSRYKFIYVSPEMLQNTHFVKKLQDLTISLFVIDEAHCISQWGHEFRTDYLKLHEVLQDLQHPTCLALTATATRQVLNDIVDSLHLSEVVYHIQSIDRPNICIGIEEVATIDDKKNKVIELVRKLQGPGMIYFSSRKWAEHISSLLTSNGIEGVSFYHGGMDHEQRLLIQQQFLQDQLQIICCTNAFGMGVNKPNVRFVIHFHYPSQMESYLQEVGRAGRDGKESLAILLYAPDDYELPEWLIRQEFPTEDELDHLFLLLNDHFSNRKRLEDEWILSHSTISEVGLRYIKYHLEANGWIKDNMFIKKMNIPEMTDLIMTCTHQRLQYKQLKLNEMRLWLKSKTCRRKSYLTIFDEALESPVEDCCDLCGYDQTKYSKKNDVSKQNEIFTWQEELKKILIKSE